MKKILIRILLILGILLVIAGIVYAGYGVYKKATLNIPNPVATIEIENYGTIKVELYPDKAPNTVANFIRLANRGYYNNSTFHRTVPDFVIQGGAKDGDTTTTTKLSDIFDLDEVLNNKELFEKILNEFHDGKLTVEETVKSDNEDVDPTIQKTITSYSQLKSFLNESEDNKNQLDDFLDEDYAISGEFIANGDDDNNIKFDKGVIAMARGDYTQYGYTKEGYDSASCQFFITTGDNSKLDGAYAAFGKVTEGLDVAEKVSNVKVYYRDGDLDNDEEAPKDKDGNTIQADTPKNPPVIKSVTVETSGIDYGAPNVIKPFDINSILYQQYGQYLNN